MACHCHGAAPDWRYLEEGPETWRVEIAKRGDAVPRAESETGGGAITGDSIVGEVARRSPAAAEAMASMGLDHCCSAGLTLREAAAAAGIEIDRLLAAVEAKT